MRSITFSAYLKFTQSSEPMKGKLFGLIGHRVCQGQKFETQSHMNLSPSLQMWHSNIHHTQVWQRGNELWKLSFQCLWLMQFCHCHWQRYLAKQCILFDMIPFLDATLNPPPESYCNWSQNIHWEFLSPSQGSSILWKSWAWITEIPLLRDFPAPCWHYSSFVSSSCSFYSNAKLHSK